MPCYFTSDDLHLRYRKKSRHQVNFWFLWLRQSQLTQLRKHHRQIPQQFHCGNWQDGLRKIIFEGCDLLRSKLLPRHCMRRVIKPCLSVELDVLTEAQVKVTKTSKSRGQPPQLFASSPPEHRRSPSAATALPQPRSSGGRALAGPRQTGTARIHPALGGTTTSVPTARHWEGKNRKGSKAPEGAGGRQRRLGPQRPFGRAAASRAAPLAGAAPQRDLENRHRGLAISDALAQPHGSQRAGWRQPCKHRG